MAARSCAPVRPFIRVPPRTEPPPSGIVACSREFRIWMVFVQRTQGGLDIVGADPLGPQRHGDLAAGRANAMQADRVTRRIRTDFRCSADVA